jgi:hypothetical protein
LYVLNVRCSIGASCSVIGMFKFVLLLIDFWVSSESGFDRNIEAFGLSLNKQKPIQFVKKQN